MEPVLLLTNDDGVGAAGLTALRGAVKRAGLQAVVIAPSTNHTGGSHRLSMDGPLVVRRVAEDTYACEGTPVDCVRVGVLSGLCPVPSVVLSGINHGANAGEDLHYSGTVAAAAEAALLNVPSVAFSQHADGEAVPFLSTMPTRFPDAAFAGLLARWLCSNVMPEHTFLNVNLPEGPMAGDLQWSTVGQRVWESAEMRLRRTAEDDVMLVDPWWKDPGFVPQECSDFDALSSGLASATLLSARGGLRDVTSTHQEWVTRVPTSGSTRRTAVGGDSTSIIGRL